MEFDWVEIAATNSEIVGRVVIAVSIFFLAGWGSNRHVRNMMTGNRELEWETNERTELPSRQQLYWGVVRIRDDIGSLVGLVCFTNGILAAILALLIID